MTVRALEPRRAAAYASISVALTLIAIKTYAQLHTGSLAVLSALIDSAVDLFASLITALAIRTADKPADTAFRFGRGKAEAIAALAQSAFIAGSAIVLAYQAIEALVHPRPAGNEISGIVVMAVSTAITLALVGVQQRAVKRTGSVAIAADRAHYLGDIAINLAVAVSLGIAALTGFKLADPITALLVALALLVSARRVGGAAIDMLLDRELGPEDRARVRQVVLAHPAARGMHDLRTRSSGAQVFIELHLELDGDLTLTQAHHVTDEIEAALEAAFPNCEALLHQEPAGLDDDRLDARLVPGPEAASG